MAIIARVAPEVREIGALPTVRNTLRYSSEPAERMADAVRSVAGTVSDYAQQQADIADSAAIMEGQRKLSEWQANWNDPNNADGVAKYRGKEALKLGEKMLQDFDQQLGSLDATMPSNRAKQKLREFAEGERIRIRDRVNTYASGQYQDYLAAENKAFETTRTNDLTNAIIEHDDKRAAELWSESEKWINANAVAMGRPDAETAERLRTMRSNVHMNVINAMSSRHPEEAERYLDDVEHVLLPEHRIEAFRQLMPILDDADGDAITKAIREGGALPSAALGYDGANTSKPAPKLPDAMRKVVEAAADKYGVPRHIAFALAWQESSFDPKAVGPQTKYGKAKGLFQYLDDTAKGLGIDPLDPVQASDAAMRQLSEQGRKRGWDWAIAHHFAGPDERQHGPKTRDYVRDVREKARRLGGSGDAVVPPASTLAEALDRAHNIANPRLRRVVEGKLKDAFELDKARAEQARFAASDAIYQKVTQADPNAPLRSVLSGDDMSFLAQDSSLSESVNRYRKLTATGQIIEDDPVLVDELARLQVNDPAKFRRTPLAQYADRLSGKTLLSLSKDQADADKPEKREEWATEAQILALAFDDMGLRGEGSADEQGKFRQAFYSAKRRFMEKTKRAPDADEAQDIVNRLKLPFVKSGFLGFGGGQRRAYQNDTADFDVPSEARARIVALYKREGMTPTEQDIRDYYIESVGFTRD